jgi:hypothetical protein
MFMAMESGYAHGFTFNEASSLLVRGAAGDARDVVDEADRSGRAGAGVCGGEFGAQAAAD